MAIPALALPAFLSLSMVAADGGDGIATLRELGPALTRCFQAPSGSAGSQITVRFSLDRNGAVLGQPRVTFSVLVGTAEQKQAFVAAALDALDHCTPVHVTPGLGSAIAGRPLSIRFVGGGPAQAI